MPGGDVIVAINLRLVHQLVELEFLVAGRAGNGCACLHVFRNEIVDHFLAEFLFEIQDVMRDADLLRHPAGIGQIVERTAGAEAFIGIPAVIPQLERNADEVVALLLEQSRGDGAVHPAAHGDDDFFIFWNRYVH